MNKTLDRKRKNFVRLIILILCSACLNACAASEQKKNDEVSESDSDSEQMENDSFQIYENIMYSNLTDKASQEEVASILQDHGISEKQTDELMKWVDDFNERVNDPLPDGFQKMTEDEVDYSELVYEGKETESGEYYPEANCRLTAFLLMRDFIQTNGKRDESDTYLMFDLEAVDTTEQFYMNEKDRSNFYSLYNWISVDGMTTVEQHKDAIQKAWKDRNIRIDSSKNISLICVYMHSTFEDVRIVGHTGVLLDLGDALLFVEKYGPAAPFSAVWFHDRAELMKYLLAREDLYGEEELQPIVFENDQAISK